MTLEIMPVDYIHYILPYSKTTLLGNVPTFFYFGITLLLSKKKSCNNKVTFPSNAKSASEPFVKPFLSNLFSPPSRKSGSMGETSN